MDKSAWQIAVLFAGAALGGTYLGGYEWLRFFAYFGSWGTIGAVLAAIALGWFGFSVLSVCHRVGIRSLHELFLYWFGEAFGPSLSVLSHFFILAYSGVIIGQHAAQMADGSVSLLFVLLPLIVASVWMKKGWDWILFGAAISLGIGFLLFGLIFLEQQHVPIPNLGYQMNVNWVVHALLYIGLHFLLTLALTIPLVRNLTSIGSLRMGIGAGSLFFFLVLMIGQAILLAYWHDIHASDSPIQIILQQLFPFGEWVVAILSLMQSGIMIAATMYALAMPIVEKHDLHLLPLILVMLAVIASFALLPFALSWSVPIIASGATYCGLSLLVRFVWKRQLP